MTPHNLLKNWQNSTLGEIFDIERGGSPRPIQDYLTDDEDGINWIKIGDVKKGEKYITSTKQKIKIEGLKKSRKIDIGDLLLTNSMSYGIPFISNIEGAIHDGWIVLKPKISLSKEFVFYFLSSQGAYQYFDNKASGSTVRNLQINYVKDTPIPLPPLEIQREIVEILESKLEKIKEAKALLETSLQECETYRLSLLESAFAGEPV